MKTVGIKYCGGCNPRYNRRKAVETLEQALPQLQFSNAQVEMQYDFLLVLCGCSAACADISALQAKQTIILWQQQDVQTCISSLLKGEPSNGME